MAVYVRPGAYSRFIETAGSVILGAGTRIPAIIGTSYTYKIGEETIQRGAGYPGASYDSLANTGVYEVISVGDFPYTSDYTEGVDFQLVNDTIDWSLGGDAPTANAKYYVRYKYTKVAADYAAKLFYSKTDAETEYGREMSDNPLATAIAIYCENGLMPFIAVQSTANTAAAYKTAIDKLQYQVEGVDATHILVLTTLDEIHTYLYTHCMTMSSMFQRKERRAIISTAIATTSGAMIAKATAFATERMIYVPQWGVRNIEQPAGTFADYTLDGTYMGCAVMGLMLSKAIEESITNQPIAGFSELSKVYLEEEADTLAQNGVLLLYTKGGIIKVRHDITTSVATPEENQWSVSEIKDYVIKNVRDVLEKQWLAKPIYGSQTVNDVKVTAERALEKLIEGRVITDYNSVTAIQNSGDNRRIDVTFKFKPVYPLIWIYINFGFIK